MFHDLFFGAIEEDLEAGGTFVSWVELFNHIVINVVSCASTGVVLSVGFCNGSSFFTEKVILA